MISKFDHPFTDPIYEHRLRKRRAQRETGTRLGWPSMMAKEVAEEAEAGS